MDNILQKNILRYTDFCKSLGIGSTADLSEMVRKNDYKRVIEQSEQRQRERLRDAVYYIESSLDTCRIVTISGPSSSGKTTFATRLTKELSELGIGCLMISLDDYFKPLSQMPLNDKNEPDMEDIEAIDYALLNDNITSLLNGEETYLPRYSFLDKKRDDKARLVRLHARELIVIEGIHGLNPLIAKDAEKNKFKVYCSAINGLYEPDGDRISSQLTRKVRRLVRDYYHRDSDWRYTLSLWEEVEKGSEKNVFPFTESADFFFNSALVYEMCVLRKHVDKVLAEVGTSRDFEKDIAQIRELAEQFEPLPDEVVPEGSILKEFIPG